MKNSLIILAMAAVLLPLSLNGQTEEPDPFVPTLDALVKMPGSPEASAFVKYGNQGISHYTGTPNISIPLANVAGRSASIPVTLTYDASGVKVEQIATWVGLGWNLNIGGAVTREVKGLPDDCDSDSAEPQYFPFYSEATPDWLLHSADSLQTKEYVQYFMGNDMTNASHTEDMVRAYADFITANNERKVDFQPDLYRFSAMGLSGSMYIDYETGKGVSVEDPTLKIEVLLAPENNGRGVKAITGWFITDGNGNRYEFQNIETTSITDGTDGGFRRYNSAWYLTKYISANSRDHIDFYYSASYEWEKEQFMAGSEVLRGAATAAISDLCPAPTVSTTLFKPTYKVAQFNLTHVNMNGQTRIQLDTLSRDDLVGKSRLSKIQLYDINGNSENVIELTQTYFQTTGDNTEFGKRLRLDKVSILGANEAANSDPDLLKEYSIEYHDQYDLPARNSLAQDHWGYYNGVNNDNRGINNQGTLIPSDSRYDHTGFNGANREASFQHAITGTIKKITYPTGGTTEFTFEPHKVDASGQSGVDGVIQLQTVIYANEHLDGYENVSDPTGHGGCGLLDNTSIFPDGNETTFTVEEDGNYTINLTITNDISENGDTYHAIVYEGANRTLCNIVGDTQQTGILFNETGTGANGSSETREAVVQLTAGTTYRILLVSNSDLLDLTVSRDEYVVQNLPNNVAESALVGGFRIKEIVDKPDSITVAQTTRYSYTQADKTLSSGLLQTPFTYVQNSPSHRMNPENGTFYTCDQVNRYASNRYTPQPQLVSYSRVVEERVGGEDNGYTVYEFHNKNASTMLPSTTSQVFNGKPTKQTVFNSEDQPVQMTEYKYNSVGFDGTGGMLFNHTIQGNYDFWVKQNGAGGLYYYDFVEMDVAYFPYSGSNDWRLDPCTEPECLLLGPQSQFETYPYSIGEWWVRLEEQTSTTFNANGDYVTKTQYKWDPEDDELFYPRSIATNDSDNNVMLATMYYPQDYDSIAGNIYAQLVSAHRLGETVRTTKHKLSEDQTKSYLLQDRKVIFDTIHGGIYPRTIQYAINGANLEDRITYENYDLKGNPLHISKDSIQHIQYMWDYGGQRPVAQATGFKLTEALIAGTRLDSMYLDGSQRNFSYTSFETTNKGGWAYSGDNIGGSDLPSGLKYYNLANGKVERTVDPTLNYHIGFWAQNADSITIESDTGADLLLIPPSTEWKYHELQLTGVNAVIIDYASPSKSNSDENFVDELRLSTSGMQLTTYAYDTAGRLISQVAPNGTPVHYEYDAHGRLIKIKDEKHNIIKLINYNYKEVLTSQY